MIYNNMCKLNTQKQGTPLEGALLSLRLFGFVGDSIVDGPGLRCVVFCQGCPHNCPGCHNPSSHSFSGGESVYVNEVYNKIQKYPLCKGVTFSGGEPFAQAESLCALADMLKSENKELAAYSGYTFEQLLQGSSAQQELLGKLDILIDGLFIESQKDLTLRFRGSSNQRIIDVPKSLASGTVVLETATRWTGLKP